MFIFVCLVCIHLLISLLKTVSLDGIELLSYLRFLIRRLRLLCILFVFIVTALILLVIWILITFLILFLRLLPELFLKGIYLILQSLCILVMSILIIPVSAVILYENVLCPSSMSITSSRFSLVTPSGSICFTMDSARLTLVLQSDSPPGFFSNALRNSCSAPS